MQLKSITSAKDCPFPNIEFVKTDKNITEVIIGGKLRIRMGESYANSLKVFVETPHIEEKRWKASAEIEGFGSKSEYFPSKYEADCAFPGLADKGAEISIVEVNALIDEDGKVVGEVGEAGVSSPQSVDSDLPF